MVRKFLQENFTIFSGKLDSRYIIHVLGHFLGNLAKIAVMNQRENSKNWRALVHFRKKMAQLPRYEYSSVISQPGELAQFYPPRFFSNSPLIRNGGAGPVLLG